MLRNLAQDAVVVESTGAVNARFSGQQPWWGRVGTAVARIQDVGERRRQRLALLDLDSRLLRDIGLSQADVRHECAKPFWRR
jgi:uncharacterized protein YjiS (DUF1127 family)